METELSRATKIVRVVSVLMIVFLMFFLGILSTSLRFKFETKKIYVVKLEIHYPSRIDTITVENSSIWYPSLSSHRGTNSVPDFYETSAPMRIISVEEIPDSIKTK